MIDALLKLYGDVWAITPEAHRTLCNLVARMPEAPQNDKELDGSIVFDGIQHIYIHGVTVPSAPRWAEEMFGLCSMERISAQLGTAAIRPDVEGVLVVYDTPGGYLPGIPSISKTLADFPKPVVGYVSASCASAGYWMACSNTLYAAEEAAVGSIGVYLVLHDYSRMFEMSGLKAILVSTGKHKGTGEPGTTITDEQIEHMRDEVIAPMGKMFFEHVQSYRDFDESLMDGRAWRGKKAAELGLIDRVGTLSDALAELKTLIQEEMI